MKSQRALEQAEQRLIEGHQEVAWKILDQLPLEEKIALPVLVMQLRILTAMEDWTGGEKYIADLCREEDRETKLTIARFYLARARWFGRMGLYEEANLDYRENAISAWRWITKEYTMDDMEILFPEYFEE